MTENELNRKVGEFLALKKIYKQIESDLETIKEELKAELKERKTDTLVSEKWKIDLKSFNYSKIDEKMFEEDIGDLSPYKKTITRKYFYLKEI
ncbi:MAG: hypothetical protein IK062_08515 [Selenomonadaceae bacterium]|nr:hypothetical protein [Selenomonadaceae bacterium]